jgi:hypothetical protein
MFTSDSSLTFVQIQSRLETIKRNQIMNWKNRGYRDRSFSALVAEGDQTRLNAFFKHELAFFNTIVENMESRLRAFPAQISEITDKQIQAMSELAQLGVSPNNINTNKLNDRLMEDVRHMPSWLSFVGNNIMRQNFAVLPATRKLMLETFLKFYRHQASILRDASSSATSEYTLRVPAANIAKQDASSKRHLQIPKKHVSTKYVHADDLSEISIPQCYKPIVVAGVNLNEINGWDLLIVRQEPGKWVDFQTPWLVEFKNTKNQYLLKLSDIGSRKRF